MNFSAYNLIAYAIEMLMVWWFLRRAEAPGLPVRRRALGVLVLAAQLPVFFLGGTLVSAILRIALRALDYYVYLRIVSDLPRRHASYYGLFTAFVFTLASNIWIILALSPGFRELAQPSFSTAGVNHLLFSFFLRYLLEFLIVYAIYRLVPIDDAAPVTGYRLSILVAAMVTEVFVRDSSNAISSGAVLPYWQSSLHLLLLHLFLLLFVVAMERVFRDNAERSRAEMQDLANRHRLEAIEASRQHDEDVRRLNHDMKNHILAIQRLVEGSDNQKLHEYLNDLGEQLDGPSHRYDVGNDFLDGFLAMKAEEARRHGIRLVVDLSLPDELALRDTELSMVFGNLLDNAIEGCGEVEDENDRFIVVKGRVRSGWYFLLVRNNFVPQGPVELHGGLPATTKEHPAGHGMGLRSVRRVADDHGGTLSINLDRPGVFEVVVSFPLE